MKKLNYGMVGGGPGSFIACVHAKQDGSFAPDMIDFPTVHDGAEGVRFIAACLKSNENGNTWVEL